MDGAVRRFSVDYDVRGLVRTLSSFDNSTVGSGSAVNQVQFSYNDFGQSIQTYQAHSGTVNTSTTPSVGMNYASGADNTVRPTKLVYPNGRELNYSYGTDDDINDSISRIATLVDDDDTTDLAEYAYLGLNDVIQVNSPEANLQYTLLLKSGRIHTAEERFLKIQNEYEAHLTPHLKYRLHANLGHIFSQKGLVDSAISHFIRASEATDDIDRKKICLAHAAQLRNDYTAASEFAGAVLERNPGNAEAALLQISSDKSTTPSRELRGNLSQEIRDSSEVLFACIEREMRAERLDEAEVLSREAMKRHSDRESFQEQLARTILLRLSKKFGRQATPEFVSQLDKAQLAFAIELTTEVLRSKKIEIPDITRAQILSLRGLARCYSGKNDEALSDWDEAASLSSSIDGHVVPYAVKLREAGRTGDAIAFLEKTVRKHTDLRIASLYAHFLTERHGHGDLEKAERVITEALLQDSTQDSSATLLGLLNLSDVLAAHNSSEFSSVFFQEHKKVEGRLTDLANRVVLAHAAIAIDDLDETHFQANRAILALPTSGDVYEKRQLALVFDSLDRKAECARLLSHCTKLDEYSDSVRLMLKASLEAGLDGLFLEIAKRLRSNGVYVELTVRNEASILAKYDALDELSELLTKAIEQGMSPASLKWIRYTRSVAAVGVGQLELVEKDPSLVPSASEHDLKELANFTRIMRYGPGVQVAVDQLYELIRRNRDAIEPKKALFTLAMLIDEDEKISNPETVCIGSAIQVQREDGVEEWFIIEDGKDPESSHNEFPPGHVLISQFLGKRVGETILSTHGFETTRITIRRILDKRKYLCMTIMEEFPEKHPDSKFLFRVSVPNDSDGTPDLRILGVQMQFWENAKKNCEQLYRENKHVPLSLLAKSVGRPLASVWTHVAEKKALALRVIHGGEEEFQNAIATFDSHLPLVLEPTAAITLLYTGYWKHLATSGQQALCQFPC